MERRRALTLPLGFDKDNLMESPLRIPVTCLSSECEKFERQVSWTELAGCKHRHCDSQHKNGSMLFDHRHAAVVTLEMSRRTPCLILTDILKTELGRSYMQRINQSCILENEGREPCKQSSSGRCRRDRQICKEVRSNQKKPCNDKDIVTPKSTPMTTPTFSQRFGIRRRLHNLDDEVDKDEKDIQEVIIGKDNGDEDCNFAEVVDCGLSVSWEPAEDELSPASIKDRWSDQEKELQPNPKRRKKDAGFQCNGTSSPKRLRESVLRLTGEDRRDGGLARPHFCLEGSEEDGSGGDVDLDCLDRSIVQFTVGADDPAEVLVPISPDLDAGDFIGTPSQSLSCNQHNTSKTSPTEPIVLSSDDEDSCGVPPPCSPAVHTLVTVEDTVIQRQSPQEAVLKPQESSDSEDSQVLHVVVHNLTLDPFTSDGDTCLNVAFSTLHCGGYRGKSSGDIMIADQKFIIPLQGTSEQAGMITLERKELRRYSVWEQQEMEAQEVCFTGDEDPLPPAVLLLCVSDAAAAAVQRDLVKLCAKHNGSRKAGKVSPFILLTLRDALEGMEGALLRSYLDIDCLNSIAHEKSIDPSVEDKVSGWGDIRNPVLSMDESVELIQSVGLDSHLLCLLGLETTECGLNTDQNGPHTETDTGTPLIQLEIDSDKGTKGETGTQPKPEEDQDKQDLEHPSEKQKEKTPPVYTVCHRRTKGSYSVSLCKLDSRWTRYKHQGLARRLIQFPPPPLKGGITVTMEDLQCLDSRQFLNDVIIDFYLKYILHKASAAVAERSHIFSSFFYKQLTRRDNASEGNTTESGQRQRRHQRVKTWTRHVDIFKKDFLFVPVNQEAHWYLAVICFPGLSEPKHETWNSPNSQTEKNHLGTDELKDHEVAKGAKSLNDTTEAPATPPTSNHSDNADADTDNAQESTKDHKPSPVSCTEKTYQKKMICKRPCILIMDSLKRSPHERVFKLLRDYLESEWEARRGSPRDFSPDVMQSSHCHVPLQDNSSDCGLYLLQYVESFLKDPVVHFDLPLHLERWFPRQQVRRKRDEIRDLVLNLYRRQNLDNNR